MKISGEGLWAEEAASAKALGWEWPGRSQVIEPDCVPHEDFGFSSKCSNAETQLSLLPDPVIH